MDLLFEFVFFSDLYDDVGCIRFAFGKRRMPMAHMGFNLLKEKRIKPARSYRALKT